ncbi:MAG: NAD(P)/FAD-dependent oxidoreductase [Deltaproteobacteria bacterium]|nr:NAD(P)/FAD-dependent oxidoreductase [Deltaproteobacteria bacterium]
MSGNNKYDAIVVGAGVGGLSVGSLLAKEGLQVLILEQADRVGGRALSIKGSEISENGLEWYKTLLASQYSYLAGSEPEIKTMIKKRMLAGYTLDIGYHAISANGAGYMYDFEVLIGGIGDLKKHGGHWGSHYKGNIYQDIAGNYIDPELYRISREEGIPYLDFYTDCGMMTDEQIDKLEKVSLQEWAEKKGIVKNDIIYNHLHAVSTLFSTINNPEDISVGDIFHYFKNAFGPKAQTGLLKYTGGFIEGGVMEWSKAVAARFASFGGTLKTNTRVNRITTRDGKVTGVMVDGKNGGQEQFESEIVISNIPAQQTFKVIDKSHFPEQWASATEKMYGYGSYAPYMGLNKLVMPEKESRLGLKNTCVLPKEEGFDYDVYICWNIQSVLDQSVAPEGKYLYTAYLPMTEKESLNKEMVNKLVNRLPDFMEEIYPGFKESIDWKLDIVCWKLEGIAKSVSQPGTRKIPVKSEYVDGLYFAGDTAKGSGVAMDCAIASGVICAGEVLGKDFGIR